MVKVPTWQCRSLAVAAPRGAPSGSGCLGTPSERLGHWAPRPLPRVLELAAFKVTDSTAFDSSGTTGFKPTAARVPRDGVCQTGLEPQTNRPQAGLLLTRSGLALDRPSRSRTPSTASDRSPTPSPAARSSTPYSLRRGRPPSPPRRRRCRWRGYLNPDPDPNPNPNHNPSPNPNPNPNPNP